MASQGQYFESDFARPEQMDVLWSYGWRHFGTYFFRYWTNSSAGQPRRVMPLRIDLAHFRESDSQRRILRKNADLEVVIRDTRIDVEKESLFERHKTRFSDNVPESLYTFLSDSPATVPCVNQEVAVYQNGVLLAASFLDIGLEATSSVYGVFEPTETKRSLGVFTMLLEIRHSIQRGCRYYYPGYAYHEASHYDYKKRFSALEYFDWEGRWRPLRDAHPTPPQ
jgi:arginine-tRNA-protein transferase